MRSLHWPSRLSSAAVTLLGLVGPLASRAWTGPPPIQDMRIEADLSALPPSERAALKPTLSAARRMDELYLRQVWPGTPALLQSLFRDAGRRGSAEIDALRFFKGPWLPGGGAFVAGVVCYLRQGEP